MSAVSLSDHSLQSAPFGANFEGNIRLHRVRAEYKRGWKSLDTPYSSSLDFIKPHKEPPYHYVYLLPQGRQFIKEGFKFLHCDGNWVVG